MKDNQCTGRRRGFLEHHFTTGCNGWRFAIPIATASEQ
jgi:hypothetical protein